MAKVIFPSIKPMKTSAHTFSHSPDTLETSLSCEHYSKNLGETLDKWDRKYCSPETTQRTNAQKNIIRQVTEIIGDKECNSLNFKQKLSQNITQIRAKNTNESLKKFYKNIEEENGSVLVQNINVKRQRFNFQIFDDPKAKQSSRPEETLKQSSSRQRMNVLYSSDELLKVGNDWSIVKKFVMKNNKTELETNYEMDEEIRIENKMLRLNNLSLNGAYDKIIDKKNYKDIITEKKKNERMYRCEITRLKQEIERLSKENEQHNARIQDWIREMESKKKEYEDSKEALVIFKKDKNATLRPARGATGETSNTTSTKSSSFLKGLWLSNTFKIMEDSWAKQYDEYDKLRQSSNEEIAFLKRKLKSNKSALMTYREFLGKITKEYIVYFKNILKEGVDVRDVGLSWVITKLYELGEAVAPDVFPKFWDYVSITYLINYSKRWFIYQKLNVLHNILNDQYYEIQKNTLKQTRSKKFYLTNDYFFDNGISKDPKDFRRFIQHLINNFKDKCINKYTLINDYYTKQDRENTEKKWHDIKGVPCADKDKKWIRKEKKKLNESINLSHANATDDEKEVFSQLLLVKGEMGKWEQDCKEMKTKHIEFFKKKYENIKMKGTYECIKYDLMFCALFGNHAVC